MIIFSCLNINNAESDRLCVQRYEVFFELSMFSIYYFTKTFEIYFSLTNLLGFSTALLLSAFSPRVQP